jgi:predicted ATP-grasp superfamily ATP-dependent carboligase
MALRILVCEWCSSGGLAGPDAHAVAEGERDALTREGHGMFLAVLRDALRDPALAVTALVDEDRPLHVPAAVHVRQVPAGAEIEALAAEASRADATLVVAPETAGILASRVAAVRAAGGHALAAGAGFIAVATDKQATIDALAAAGVPVPAGRPLAAGEPWPVGFHLPAVRKARAGAGGDDLVIVRPGDPLPAAATQAARLEAFVDGTAVGVSCLCGPLGIEPLPAFRQHFSATAPGRFIGAEPLANQALDRRGRDLARRAIAAVVAASAEKNMPAPPAGWVGVDIILGHRADGRDDRVLEINPRLTSSFIGHSSRRGTSLVRAMLDVAAGREPHLPSDDGVAFTVADDAPLPHTAD